MFLSQCSRAMSMHCRITSGSESKTLLFSNASKSFSVSLLWRYNSCAAGAAEKFPAKAIASHHIHTVQRQSRVRMLYPMMTKSVRWVDTHAVSSSLRDNRVHLTKGSESGNSAIFAKTTLSNRQKKKTYHGLSGEAQRGNSEKAALTGLVVRNGGLLDCSQLSCIMGLTSVPSTSGGAGSPAKAASVGYKSTLSTIAGTRLAVVWPAARRIRGTRVASSKLVCFDQTLCSPCTKKAAVWLEKVEQPLCTQMHSDA